MAKESREIKDLSFEEFEKTFPNASRKSPTPAKKKGILGALLQYPFKFLGAMFGIDKKTVTTRNVGKGNSSIPVPQHTSPNIRETYKQPFNPYSYDMASQIAYYKLIDGKGDCDHDHGEH